MESHYRTYEYLVLKDDTKPLREFLRNLTSKEREAIRLRLIKDTDLQDRILKKALCGYDTQKDN